MALNTNVCDNFRNAFEQKCFHLINEACQNSLSEAVLQLDWNENDITSELHKHIKENPLRIKWRVSSNVEVTLPKNIPKVKGFADKFPRIDIRLTSFISIYEYEYFFEAKNLKQDDSALKRRYIDTGIDNFVSGKYKNGSLLGYLIKGNTNKTIEGINRLLENDNRNTEILIFKSHKIFEYFYESEHLKIGTLKHIILDLTTLLN